MRKPLTFAVKTVTTAALALTMAAVVPLSPATTGAGISASVAVETAQASTNYTAHTWSYAKYPLYYKVRGKANTSAKVAKGKTREAGIDKLGRTRSVVAKVTYKMVEASAGWRESMPSECDQISGWGHNKKVKVKLSNGRTYKGYAYNRSHLLADCLGGHAKRTNMVTGTRTQNVGNNVYSKPGGMQYTEEEALNYLYSHKNGWVYYRATPVYKGKELVCRSVYVDILSDDGSINQHVEVFNAMRGYKVNYKTGTISKVSSKKTTKKTTAKTTYVYITATGAKYHRAGCRYLTASATKVTLKTAKTKGLTACAVCW